MAERQTDMRITGIVCEYDPFHNGHRYLLEWARKKSDAIVCVMSGNATERGSFAIVDKYTRAEMALRSGADLVLELPYPYSSASAEFFASAGVSVLASVGVDLICFGSESGDVERLKRAAAVARDLVPTVTHDGRGTADGYFSALAEAYEATYGEPLCPESNDILGIEYCKAILSGGYDIEPIAVTRLGDGFRKREVEDTTFASATAIRRLIREGRSAEIAPLVPDVTADLLKEAIARGDAPVDMGRLATAILAFLRTADPEGLAAIAELGNGLEYRLTDASREATSLTELFASAATKKYTDAKIRRAVLFAMTGVTAADLRAPVGYTTVLGATKVGCELLSALRKQEGGIPIITKPADGQKASPRQYALSLAADSLFGLAHPKAKPAGEWMRKNPVIL